MEDARQTPAGRHVTARVVVGMTETQYARWRRDHASAVEPTVLPEAGGRPGCDWHKEGGYGFVWDCRGCNPGHPAYASAITQTDPVASDEGAPGRFAY